jgi:hypothetical protein
MKKVVLFTCALLALSGFAWADQKNTGCGLGSMAFEGQEALMSQTLAVTTNGTFGNQTFGITSGTSNCQKPANFTHNERLYVFISENMDNLARDIARGQGEYLNTVAVLMNIPEQQRYSFGSHLRTHFADIYTSDKVQQEEVFRNLNQVAMTL